MCVRQEVWTAWCAETAKHNKSHNVLRENLQNLVLKAADAKRGTHLPTNTPVMTIGMLISSAITAFEYRFGRRAV